MPSNERLKASVKKKHEIPNDSLIKEKYHKKLNEEYKKKCKSKRKKFWKNTFEDIENSLGGINGKIQRNAFQPKISGNK